MDGCVVDGIACFHNTAISVEPEQKFLSRQKGIKTKIYKVSANINGGRGVNWEIVFCSFAPPPSKKIEIKRPLGLLL